MPVPHDYYDYDSDAPHLHNRDHARPYVEPDWQAHAAGHQLPVLSTIGRGPQGDGLLVSNIVNDGRSFSFDIVSDVTGEPIAKIGPIPSGAVHVTSDEDSITFTTNKLGPNNTIATEVTKIDMPKGEAGSIIYLYPDQLERNSSDIYVLDAEKMVAYNRRGLNRRPDMKVDDIVIGQLKDGDDGYLFFGTVVNADSQQAIMVAGQTFIPVAALMGPQGPKGDPGEKGDNGENGAKGDDGTPGVSPVCSWNGTVLTITDGTGPHSMDLKGETGQIGQTGADGKSAYQVAVDNGYQGSQADWLMDLKGPKGDDGAPGATGPQGPAGGASIPVKIFHYIPYGYPQFNTFDFVLPASEPCAGYDEGILPLSYGPLTFTSAYYYKYQGDQAETPYDYSSKLPAVVEFINETQHPERTITISRADSSAWRSWDKLETNWEIPINQELISESDFRANTWPLTYTLPQSGPVYPPDWQE